MNELLYTGHVAHQRITPAENRFRYRVYYLYLDVDTLDELDAARRLFSHNRFNLVSFFDSDHGPRDGSSLRPWIDSLLAQVGVDLDGGRVCLLTFPRVLGFRFYPVSFWYCYHADGTVRAVLAEVQNTYRDHHNYLLTNSGAPLDREARPTMAKAFYVSPFMQLDDVRHEFALSEPGSRLDLTIRDFVEGQLTLTTSLSLQAHDLTDPGLLRVVLGLGPISVRALVLIYWQALKLWSKRVPYFARTPPPREETSLR